ARVRELRDVAKAEKPDVALSHNSYAQLIAARSLRLPAVTAMDYEHQPANNVAFRCANRILLPEPLPIGAVRRQGARSTKATVYPGLKEELYVGDFRFDPNVLHRMGFERAPGEVLVVLRAPPARAIYHRRENPTYAQTIERIGTEGGVRAVVLARHP